MELVAEKCRYFSPIIPAIGAAVAML